MVIDATQRANITALACSTPPPGYARWRLRLLANTAAALAVCAPLSHTARQPHLNQTGGSGAVTPRFWPKWSGCCGATQYQEFHGFQVCVSMNVRAS